MLPACEEVPESFEVTEPESELLESELLDDVEVSVGEVVVVSLEVELLELPPVSVVVDDEVSALDVSASASVATTVTSVPTLIAANATTAATARLPRSRTEVPEPWGELMHGTMRPRVLTGPQVTVKRVLSLAVCPWGVRRRWGA